MDLFHRVRVNKPIDWANTWSLEEQVRGISFEHDGKGNLKGMPVVLVDTTKPNIVPVGSDSTPGQIIYDWLVYSGIAESLRFNLAATHQSFWLTAVNIDIGNATDAATGMHNVNLKSADGTLLLNHRVYVGATVAEHPSFFMNFSHPIRFEDGIYIGQNPACTAGGISVGIWGYIL